MRLMMLVAALSSCDALRLAGVAQPRSALRSRVPHISLKQQRKGGLFGAMDDILDYVSDLGGCALPPAANPAWHATILTWVRSAHSATRDSPRLI